MPSYDVSPNGKVIGAPPGVQKQFDDLMGENRAWAKANPDKIAAANSGPDDKKRPR